MAFRKRIPKRINTTPVLDRQGKYSFAVTLAKTLVVPAVVFGSLLWFGQPALRIQYEWSGSRAHPIYHQCDYLTLLNGWRDVHPRYGYCPLITSFPFELSHLTGE